MVQRRVVYDENSHEVNNGNVFFASGSAALDNTDTFEIQLTTPDTAKRIKVSLEFGGTEITTLQVYEESTVDGDGDAIALINSNRNSAVATTLALIESDGGVTTAGDLIITQVVGVANVVYESHMRREMVLAQDTSYRFLFTSSDDANAFIYCLVVQENDVLL